jgi:hypothetical protein
MKLSRLPFVCISLMIIGALARAQSNPVPLINQPLIPVSVVPGGPGFTLTVNGTGFVSGGTVNWNGIALATTFVSHSQLAATVPATNITNASTASVTVVNPTPGGGASNIVFFQVATPLPSLAVDTSSTFATSLQQIFQVLEGDFIGNGNADLVFLDFSHNNAQVVLGNGNGSFSPLPSFVAMVSEPLLDLTGDFNNDGKLDFVMSDPSAKLIRVYLSNGDGTFSSQDTNLMFRSRPQDLRQVSDGPRVHDPR